MTIHEVAELTEEDFANAVFRLDSMCTKHPKLRQAVAKARARLAAAIIAYDAAPDWELAHRAVATDLAVGDYSQALANLLRGEYPGDIEDDAH